MPALAVPCNGGTAPVCTFRNDYAGFLFTLYSIGGTPRTIDFETLPDGSPSHPGPIYLTPTFNYTPQGVTFSAPIGQPYIGGNPQSGYDLQAYSGNIAMHDWIIGNLSTPTHAVGTFFPGATTLSAYDAQGSLIGSTTYNSSGEGFFVGIVSDTPIARTINNDGGYSEDIESYILSVPEPATALLVAYGVTLATRRARRRRYNRRDP